MTSRALHTTLLAPILLGALALAACSTGPAPSPTPTTTESAPPAAPVETPDASPSATAEASAPSCDTLISASLVDELTSYGWTSRADDFLGRRSKIWNHYLYDPRLDVREFLLVHRH